MDATRRFVIRPAATLNRRVSSSVSVALGTIYGKPVAYAATRGEATNIIATLPPAVAPPCPSHQHTSDPRYDVCRNKEPKP